MPRIASAFIVMAIVVAVVLVMRTETGAEKPPGRMADAMSKELAHAPKGTLRPEAVLAIAPGPAGQPPKAAAAAARLSPRLREYRDARELKPIYDKLVHLDHPTGEEQWMLASILQGCARVTEDEPDRFKLGTIGDAAARERFLASLPASDPSREQRIAAFDQVNYDRCGDLRKLDVSRKQIQDLY